MIENIIYLEASKILVYSLLAFFGGLWSGPILITLLRWMKFWKKKSRSVATDGTKFEYTAKFYQQDEAALKIPRAGGILIWFITLFMATFFWVLYKIDSNEVTRLLNFVSRKETFIPLGTLFSGSLVGFIDDALSTMETTNQYKAGGGLHLKYRAVFILVLAFLISLWFYIKVGIESISIFNFKINFTQISFLPDYLDKLVVSPYSLSGGIVLILITMFIIVGLWTSSVIDGFDGISSGTMIPIFACFGILSFAKGFYDISTLIFVILGSLVAYLWFNIPPAKVYMGETGMMGLLVTLAVIAIIIDAVYVLPIAGLMLVLTSASVLGQLFSKKFFKRKILLAAPLHHHFEALGISRVQITLRYWLISVIMSILGLAVGLIFR